MKCLKMEVWGQGELGRGGSEPWPGRKWRGARRSTLWRRERKRGLWLSREGFKLHLAKAWGGPQRSGGGQDSGIQLGQRLPAVPISYTGLFPSILV